MKYKPDQIQTREIKDATLEKGKFSKKVVHVAAGAPAATDDTGLGYEQGSIWIDSSNGDMYICSDHSAEDAVWRNMEGDDVNPPFVIQGSSYGYHYQTGNAGGHHDRVDRFALTSPGNASDIGELADIGTYTSRGSTRNTTHNYYVGLSNGPPGAGAHKSQIWRFPFTSPSSSADVGEHSLAPTYAPQSPSSFGATGGACDGTTGFIAGGEVAPPTIQVDHIDKFTMASPAPSSDTGAELTATRNAMAGASDIVGSRMFFSGGWSTPANAAVNIIEQAAFSISSGTTSDWGDCIAATRGSGGTQSTTHGYVQAGRPPSNQISKYPFSSPGDAADVGNLTSTHTNVGGCSSTTHGYRMGGSPEPQTNIIDNYPFSSDDDASDVGDLTAPADGGSGCEI